MYGSFGGRPQGYRNKLNTSQLWTLIVAPCMVSIFVFILVAFVYHRHEHLVFCIIAAGMLVSGGAVIRNKQQPFQMHLAFFCFMGWVFASVLGLGCHGLAFSHYWRLHDSNAYGNVFPSQSAAAVADAGKISFVEGTKLDVSKALGYKDVSVYCVAPIVDEHSTTVQFWAVGTDCCPARGGFTCDDAWISNARSGVVIRHSDSEETYIAAIKQAEAAFEIDSSEDYMLVRWVVDPETVELNLWRLGVIFLVLGVLIGQVLFGVAALGLNFVLQGYTSFLK